MVCYWPDKLIFPQVCETTVVIPFPAKVSKLTYVAVLIATVGTAGKNGSRDS
jgi:hypothetical protein